MTEISGIDILRRTLANRNKKLHLAALCGLLLSPFRRIDHALDLGADQTGGPSEDPLVPYGIMPYMEGGGQYE